MPLIIIFFFLGLAYAEFKLISTVYSFIALRYDAMSAVFLVLLSFFLAVFIGSRLLRAAGGKLVRRLQSGQVNGRDTSRSFLYLLAGILFIIPGYVSDVVALVCLFPPTAWILSKLVPPLLQKWMKSSNFGFYTNLGGFGASTQTPPGPATSEDATIIDVEAFEAPKKLL